MTEYAPGTPMWVDVSSPDMDRSRAFYSGLFGWDAQVVPDPQAGGYTMFFRDGKMVGAAGPTFSPDQHPAWSTYVCTADADATAQAVKDTINHTFDAMGKREAWKYHFMVHQFVSNTDTALSALQARKQKGSMKEVFAEHQRDE